MNLVIDAGNTKTALGVYNNGTLLFHWTVETNPAKTADEYGVIIHQLFQFKGLKLEEIDGIIISSVVPQMDQCLKKVCASYFQPEPMFIGPGIKTGLNILYDNPKEVGSDRIVNAVAGTAYYGSPLIIVDFGTATTFCYINEKKQYAGGVIAPGMSISMDALSSHASKLPKVETIKAKSVIGKNTVHAMQSGFLYGMAAQVEGMVSRIKKEARTHPAVVATGSMATMIKKETDAIDFADEWLTLKGLQLIYEKNTN
ncbi:type III pantothenate kinase [Salipaludibacillus sp. CUR1]|uniref:type III pantothenate kinase n=1 Tax=Salipaludibacillus sp. CUR1 TaxID=2820003 RepID=UPI001E441D4B|nr:type III pantothenate kinase [Salipaludibacillus sp. CUR1]MCE7791274.1 type III pantothenate kinase [Salipaludibacillus sp. CUR1]